MFYRFFLLIVGLITLYTGYSNDVLVTFSFYFSLILSSLFLLNFKRNIKLTLYIAFIILASYIKELIPFMPLICYDMYNDEYNRNILLLTLIPLVNNYDKNISIYVLLFIFISIILKDRNINYEKLENDYYDFQENIEYERDNLNKKLQNTNKLIDENTELAIIKERARIARDIHDNLGHSLTRSLYQLKMHEMKSGVDLSDVKENINNSMLEIRNSVHNLQNTTIDLNEEIEKIIAKEDKLKIYYKNNLDRELNSKVKLGLLYTIKECLVNTLKHSNATKFDIQIFEINSEINMLIKDNGSNYEPIKPGIGLINIENRVKELGGKVTLSTDNGFRVFIKLSLEEKWLIL